MAALGLEIPVRLTQDQAVRFWSKVDLPDSPEKCWIWTGAKNAAGYGNINISGRHYMPHRVSWVLANKRQIPKGLVIDHLCSTPSCINPHHLEPVSQRSNVLRGEAHKGTETPCDKGHLNWLVKVNRHGNLTRRCVDCRREWDRVRRETPERKEFERLRSRRRAAARKALD